jgi:CubicO group peptidase (beta-lactamase class C family)
MDSSNRAQSAPHIWQEAGLRDAGFAADMSEKIDCGVRSGLIPGLHAIVVARHGKIAAERYYTGDDVHWGRPLGDVAHGPDTLHDLRSVTKSIVSLLYGIALERGQVPPPSAPLLAQFPRYADLAADPKRARLTIGHALTMSLGTQWDEDIPYTNPANSEIQMEDAKDRLRFVLDRPIVEEPGQRWVYNGGASALLGALISEGTGQRLDEFAREALFGPLGISEFDWSAGRDGAPSAASGLRLTARSMARIGQLVLDGGMADSRQIVPKSWLEQSVIARLPTGQGPDYGYQWWLGTAPVKAMDWSEQSWIGGFGNGGQRLFIMPSTGIVMAAFFGNYDQMNAWMYPGRIWWEIVLPGLERV